MMSPAPDSVGYSVSTSWYFIFLSPSELVVQKSNLYFYKSLRSKKVVDKKEDLGTLYFTIYLFVVHKGPRIFFVIMSIFIPELQSTFCTSCNQVGNLLISI